MSRAQPRPLGTSPKASVGVGASPNPTGTTPTNIPRRSAGALPGIARTASHLRQSSSPLNPSVIASLPAHLRNLSAPRIPSPLGKGTPARQTKQSLPLRTSKTTGRHVFLPEDPQLAPLPKSPMGSNLSEIVGTSHPPRVIAATSSSSGHLMRSAGHIGTPYHHDERSDAEKMTKREREENRLPRLTAYNTADAYRLKLLQAFLKREHGVGVVRVFDDCVYAVYNLPLLPGYGASTQVRSSPAVKSPGGLSMLERMTQAEDVGYDDEYFPVIPEEPVAAPHDPSEYILSHSPPSPIATMGSVEEILHPNGHSHSHEHSEHTLDLGHGQEHDVNGDHDRLASLELSRHDGLEYGPDGENEQEVHLESPPHEDSIYHGALGLHAHDHGVTPIPQPGTHLSLQHPGYLEHTPSMALTPSDLPSQPQPHNLGSPRKRFSDAGPPPTSRRRKSHGQKRHNDIAEAVFYSYGVSVFFGFHVEDERAIMADCENAGVWSRGQDEDDWEIEEFHYVYDPDAEYPRIYNDMFTFTSHSHLFKLSLAHAIAQSTKLSIYESIMQESLALTSSFPKELAVTGHLQLNRIDALKMTGRLFKLRMDVNLIGGILDTPELFWSEASLYPLYEAIREYLEIGPRVQVLNDRLAVVGDLLEIIHEYIDQRAMHRITWIVIWLIVVACVVEVGEVIARLVFHDIERGHGEWLMARASRTILGSSM